MGLFDYRCMISGLSLKSSKTTLILLEKAGDNYLPIALPVFGQYNRLGAIDMIEENKNTKDILTFFQSKINSGEIKVDWEEVYWQGEFLKKIENIEQLFTAIERSVTMEYDCVTLNKQRIEYSLINTRIWNEIVCFDFENKEPNLIPSKTWKEIYNQPNSDYDYLEHQFKKAQNFLNKHNLKWTPPNDSGQHYDEEVNDYLEQAKSKFIDEPLMMNGILAYEKELDS